MHYWITGNVTISANSKSKPSPRLPSKSSGKDAQTQNDPDSEGEDGGIQTSLRLVCSMSGNHSRAVWEDVTDTTPMTIHMNEAPDDDDGALADNEAAIVENDTISHGTPSRQRAKYRRKSQKSSESPRSAKSSSSVSTSPGYVEFTTLVSASFWLVHCPNWMRSDMLTLVDQLYKVWIDVTFH